MQKWAEDQGITLAFIQPGKPQQGYNNDKPNITIGGITPAKKLKQANRQEYST